MIRRIFTTIIISASLLATSHSQDAMAESRYISDILYVPLRSGPSNSNKIIHRGLKSGTRLEFIREEDDEFTYVRTTDGVEGYIRSQYLLTQPGAREQFRNASARAQRLQEENTALKAKLNEIQKNNASLQSSGQQSSQQSARLQKELDELKSISSEAINMVSRNKTLVEKNVILQNRIETLELENSRLDDDSTKQWYLYGAATIVLGIFIGLIAPLMRSRRKGNSSWA